MSGQIAPWSALFWSTARRIAAEHGFEIVPGNHKDHYKLHRRRPAPDTVERRRACIASFAAAGMPARLIT